jgi:AcrR family transcriptional regulator
MPAATKERILDASGELMRRQGYTGTGMKQIVAAADAPFGSLYHFFPGGKEELGEAVIRSSGEMYYEIVLAVWNAATDPIAGVHDIFAGAAQVLRDTDYADACPIATIALEVASTSEPLRRATADVFDRWITGATEKLRASGIPKRKARELAIAILSLLEGAFIFCRALRTTEPLNVAGVTAVTAVRAALPARRPSR